MQLPALVILDRDGVINRDSDDYIKSAREWHPLPGSIEAIGRLTSLGIPVGVATNQSGIGRGYFGRPAVYRMHRKLRLLAAMHGGAIEQIEFCPHLPGAGCECRKPQPGMLLRILKRQQVSPAEAVMVGDTEKDIIAGRRAGMQTVLVRSGKHVDGTVLHRCNPDTVVDNLFDYVASLAGR